MTDSIADGVEPAEDPSVDPDVDIAGAEVESVEAVAPAAEVAPAPPVGVAAAPETPPAVLPPADPALALPAAEETAPAAEVPVAEARSDDEAVAAGFAEQRPRIALWTFLVYDLVWLGLAGALVYYLLNLPAGMATYEAPLYEPVLWAAIALLGIGVLLVPVVWLISRTQVAERKGLFAAVAITGALAVLVGALLWWGALAIVDYVRLGRVY